MQHYVCQRAVRLQVSGITFAFNPQQPSGHRVLPDSVTVAGERLELQRTYVVGTKHFLLEGKDGYGSFAEVCCIQCDACVSKAVVAPDRFDEPASCKSSSFSRLWHFKRAGCLRCTAPKAKLSCAAHFP